MTRRLTIRLANLWRDNPHIERDLRKLLGDRTAHIVGINEGANFSAAIESAAKACHYKAVGTTGPRVDRQNPILIRDDIKILGHTVTLMCHAVGRSPARSATFVLYVYGGQKRAHINTHANSHVQEGNGPHELPRVAQYVQHMKRLSLLIRQGRAEGYRVTVSGDLNWSWSARILGWHWTPKRTFKRLQMRVQWAGRDNTGPTHGRRRIDYLAHDPRDLTITGQRLLDGHSDHKFPECHYIIKEKP